MKHVPYIVYESSMTRGERHARRLTIALTVALIVLGASNIAWLVSAMLH